MRCLFYVFFSFFTKGHHRLSALKTSNVSLSAPKSSLSARITNAGASQHLPFFPFKSRRFFFFWLKSAKTDLFCSFPGACKWTKPLEPRETDGADVPQLRPIVAAAAAAPRGHLWVPPLLEAADCFSFWISGRVLARGFRWALEHVMSIWPEQPPPHSYTDPSLTALPTFSYVICALPRSED